MPYDMTQPALRRVRLRPDPDHWRPDELMTIPEAAALFFPDGPLSPRGLLTARRDAKLATTMVARKIMTTPGAIRAMGDLSLQQSAPEAVVSESVMSPESTRVAEAQRALLGRLTPPRRKR